MYKKDTNQPVRAPGQGQAINTSDLRKIVALILQCVKGGRGILVERVGQSVIVSQKTGGRGGGGGGNAWPWYEADSKAELPNTDIPSRALGRAAGEVFVRNPANNGWDSLTHLE